MLLELKFNFSVNFTHPLKSFQRKQGYKLKSQILHDITKSLSVHSFSKIAKTNFQHLIKIKLIEDLNYLLNSF